MSEPLVAVVMGSKSDAPTMQECTEENNHTEG